MEALVGAQVARVLLLTVKHSEFRLTNGSAAIKAILKPPALRSEEGNALDEDSMLKDSVDDHPTTRCTMRALLKLPSLLARRSERLRRQYY